MRTKWFISDLIPYKRAICMQSPTLKIVVDIRHHDLIENLLVNRMILDGNKGFHPIY